MATFLLFGASIAHGVGDESGHGGWAGRLRSTLDTLPDTHLLSGSLLYNLSISGDTSTGLRKRFLKEVHPRLNPDQNKNCIIFSLGGNDASFFSNTTKYKVSLAIFQQNFDFLLTKAKLYSQKVLVLGLTPVDESKTLHRTKKPTSKSNQATALYTKALEDLCHHHQVEYRDLASAFIKQGPSYLLSPDGVHPNAHGHQLIFELAWNSLVEA